MEQELLVSEIGHRMHWIRGQRVMLDKSLADFYQVENSALKRSVRRNISRFPHDFMFELTEVEEKTLICQFGISKPDKGENRGGNRHSPFAFTEPGVAMLSSILKSERAVQVNIAIMRAFIQLRQVAESNGETVVRLDQLESRMNSVESKLDHVLRKLESAAVIHSSPVKSLPQVKWVEKSINKIEIIQNGVAQYYGLKPQNLKSFKRKTSIVLPRQIAMYLAYNHAGFSFTEIGRYFGGKDHSTVLHACRKIADAIERNDPIREAVHAIEKDLWN